MSVGVRVVDDPEALAAAAELEVVGALGEAVRLRGRATLALSGGSTPRRLYERLGASDEAATVLAATELFWSDERFVPREAPESNYRLVLETLLSTGRVPPERVHPIPTGVAGPALAAEEYERLLRARFAPSGPTFDLAVMGIGPDGHTASLFPGTPAVLESERWVVPVDRAPVPPYVPRVTLTVPALDRARQVLFLAYGPQKSSIVGRALAATGPLERRLPAARIFGTERTIWILDRPAASAVPDPLPRS